MTINQAMDAIKRELDRLPATHLREFLDELCNDYRKIDVTFIWNDGQQTASRYFK